MVRRVLFMVLTLTLGVAFAGCGGSGASTGGSGSSTTITAAAATAVSPTTTTPATTTAVTLAPGTMLAEVGSVTITQEMFETRLAQVKAQNPKKVPDEAAKPDAYLDFERSVLENMVRLELVRQKADAIGATVTDADVKNQIDQIVKRSFGGNQSKLEASLAGQKTTLAQFQASLREQLLMQNASKAVTKDVPAPSDAQIEAFYSTHLASYYQAETRDVRHILIRAAGAASTGSKTTSSGSTTTTAAPTDADWAAAKALVDKISAELAAGADFAQEAATFSEDARTKDLGGSLGTIKKGQTTAEFEASAFSLADGEVSQPVKTSLGYHIIRVDKITPGKQLTLDEVKASVTTAALNAAKKKVWEDWIAAMKKELSVTFREGMQTTTTTSDGQAITTTTG